LRKFRYSFFIGIQEKSQHSSTLCIRLKGNSTVCVLPEYLQIPGYPSESDLRGINGVDVFVKPDGRKELIDELLKRGFVKNRVIHVKKRDGTPLSVSVTALAEFDTNKNLVFINGIVQDITGFLASDRV
jgi:PAS domain-containing protein